LIKAPTLEEWGLELSLCLLAIAAEVEQSESSGPTALGMAAMLAPCTVFELHSAAYIYALIVF
jgi:hypothetical protein